MAAVGKEARAEAHLLHRLEQSRYNRCFMETLTHNKCARRQMKAHRKDRKPSPKGCGITHGKRSV